MLYVIFALLSASTHAATVFPQQLTTNQGRASTQPVSVLSSLELSGTTDNWSTYVEFYAGKSNYVGTFRFVTGPLKTLTVKANFKGAIKTAQAWRFQLRDVGSGQWVTVGDNTAARSWTWSQLSFPVSSPERFVASDGSVRLRYSSVKPGDDSNLDYLALEYNTAAQVPTPAPPPPPTPNPPSGAMTNKTFTVSNEVIVNPEKGFYRWVELMSGGDLSFVRIAKRSLAFSYIRLDAYRNSAIDSAFLTRLEAGLARARSAGVKIVLRFAYNAGPYPKTEPDASKARILGHLEQLKPVLQRNADVLLVVQGGFIGAWGEWHTSTNGLDNTVDRRDILYALVDAIPANRMAQIRVPNFKADILSSTAALTTAQAFTGTRQARIGHHNDCFLASSTDEGTYPSNAIEAWKNYVAAEGRFTPVGGETCAYNPPRSDCSTAESEMRRLHFSYLNDGFEEQVLNSWRAQGCFDRIARDMGYRFALNSVSYTTAPKRGTSMALNVSLKNLGYAAMFNKRPVFAVLKNSSGRHVFDLSMATGGDPRRWESEVNLQATFVLPATMGAGTYTLTLWLPDEAQSLRSNPAYSVQLSTTGVWEAASGENVIGQVSVAP